VKVLGTLIIFSGLPGSGKSTLASKVASTLKAAYLRIDTVEQGLRDICEISEVDGKGYLLSHRIAQENLRLGNSVVADSVNPWSLTRREWNNVASDIGANFLNIELVCSNKGEHKKRIENRGPSVVGLKAPTWKDIQERDYHSWNEERILLDTSGKDVETSLGELLLILKEKGCGI
jgi:predicted kinase